MGWDRIEIGGENIYCTTCPKPNKTPTSREKETKKKPSLTVTITRLLACDIPCRIQRARMPDGCL